MPANLISSTSFFLSSAAKKISEGKLTLDEMRSQLEGSVITPVSKFDTAEDVIGAYGETYFHGIDGQVVLDVTKAYIEGVNKAKSEGRYFGRNRVEVDENFNGNRQMTENGLVSFYNKH